MTNSWFLLCYQGLPQLWCLESSENDFTSVLDTFGLYVDGTLPFLRHLWYSVTALREVTCVCSSTHPHVNNDTIMHTYQKDRQKLSKSMQQFYWTIILLPLVECVLNLAWFPIILAHVHHHSKYVSERLNSFTSMSFVVPSLFHESIQQNTHLLKKLFSMPPQIPLSLFHS